MYYINGEGWRVVLVNPEHPSLVRPDGSITVGSCDDVTKTIYISDNIDGAFLRKVLCHELVHAAMFS